jgi:uncharacterized lipoprotein YddW (UPF0748 family)
VFGQTSGTAGPYLRRLSRSTTVQPSDEIRALWVVRDALTTPEAIDRCIDLAVQSRFHILFVQVRGRADAWYNSTLEPHALDLRYPIRDFDPLLYMLTRAREVGIEVHAWINVYFAWSNGQLAPPDGHIVRVHPEWLESNSAGTRMDGRPVDDWKADGIEGYYISPFSAPAREHIVAVVRDLVDQYPVDGVHLDYVRFPGADYGYGADVRTRFELEWGIDPADLHGDFAGVSSVVGAEAAATMDSLWMEKRVQQVDSMVVAIREAIGDLPLSAAVVPEPGTAREIKGQDWISWIKNRWVDFVVPMAYNHRPEDLLDWVRIVHRTIGRERLLVGLAIYGGREAWVDRSINILRVDGVSGFSVFSYNVLADMRFPAAFVEGIFFAPDPPAEEENPPVEEGAEEGVEEPDDE